MCYMYLKELKSTPNCILYIVSVFPLNVGVQIWQDAQCGCKDLVGCSLWVYRFGRVLIVGVQI